LADILAFSAERWGVEGRRRYAAALTAAMRKIAAEPDGPLTHDRAELFPGIRSFHLRDARVSDRAGKVRRPAHVLFYRVAGPGLVEVVRVLHERTEPSRHLGAKPKE